MEMARACFEKIEDEPESGLGREVPPDTGKPAGWEPHRLASLRHLLHGAEIPNPFRRGQNEWIETDRREQRRIVLTVLAFFATALVGIGILIYALLD